MENEIVVRMKYGSHLYGLNTPDSDTDYKTIVLPTAKEIVMQKADFTIKSSTGDAHGKNTADDIDDEIMSLSKFLDMAMAGKNTALDMLHAGEDVIIESSPLWDELQANRHLFYTKDMSTYVDYVQGQAAKYGVKGSRLAALSEAMEYLRQFEEGADGKFMLDQIGVGALTDAPTRLGEVADGLPLGEHAQIIEVDGKVGKQQFYEICQRKFDFKNGINYVIDAMQKIYDGYGHRAKLAESNEGVDWKAVSHALRAGYQARAIYAKGGFEYPLAETDFIMNVKTGQCDYKTVVQPAIEELVAEVTELAEKSSLPETCDREYWEQWLLKQHVIIIFGEIRDENGDPVGWKVTDAS